MTANLEVLRERAKKMRKAPTGAEHHLIHWLKKAGVTGTIKRQVVIGRMIIDLAIPSMNLLIEIDGPSHATKRLKDARRTAWLESCGFRVVRVTNREVLHDGARTAMAIVHGAKASKVNEKAFSRSMTVARKSTEN